MVRIGIAILAVFAGCASVAAQNYVNGYFKQDGTYVQPHVRTNPDNSRLNNYSTQGNTNPYTGQQGTVDPYKPLQQGHGGNYVGGGQRRW